MIRPPCRQSQSVSCCFTAGLILWSRIALAGLRLKSALLAFEPSLHLVCSVVLLVIVKSVPHRLHCLGAV